MGYEIPNWTKIAQHVGTRDNKNCRQHWNYSLRPELKSLRKGKWTTEEDAKLRQLCMAHQCKNERVWGLISKEMGYARNHKQCRDRWCNHLDPSLRHGPWTSEEDAQLLDLHERFSHFGNKWKKIAAALAGRSSQRIRRRFAQLEKKC